MATAAPDALHDTPAGDLPANRASFLRALRAPTSRPTSGSSAGAASKRFRLTRSRAGSHQTLHCRPRTSPGATSSPWRSRAPGGA